MTAAHIPVLTIAGSEATGGAGAQADLKTFQALDVIGVTALTCIVSFDPTHDWNHRFVPVDPHVIADQLEVQFATYDIDTVKIGMLGTPDTIDVVAGVLQGHNFRNLVVDPVLICKGQEPGAALDVDNALRAKVLPHASFVTPNLVEAEILADMPGITSVEQLSEAAQKIHTETGAVVLAKGGMRLEGPDAVDVYCDGEVTEVLSRPKIGDRPIAGAGCTTAAAVAAYLARGDSPRVAAEQAKAFVATGIENRLATRAPFETVVQ